MAQGWQVRGLVVLLAAAMLGGCSTFRHLDNGLTSLVGHHESVAFDALGYPTSAQQFGGDTVYSWVNTENGAIIIPQTETSRGRVGNKRATFTTTYNQAVPYNWSCIVKVITNDAGMIKKWEYKGNRGGCEYYAKRLKNYQFPLVLPQMSNTQGPAQKYESAAPSEGAKVEVTKDAAPKDDIKPGTVAIAASDSVWMYRTPYRDAERVARLDQAEQLDVAFASGEWLFVSRASGAIGWVIRQAVTLK